MNRNLDCQEFNSFCSNCSRILASRCSAKDLPAAWHISLHVATRELVFLQNLCTLAACFRLFALKTLIVASMPTLQHLFASFLAANIFVDAFQGMATPTENDVTFQQDLRPRCHALAELEYLKAVPPSGRSHLRRAMTTDNGMIAWFLNNAIIVTNGAVFWREYLCN